MVCRARAYYAARPERYWARSVLDMRHSERRGREFIRLLFGELGSLRDRNVVLRKINCDEEGRRYSVVFADQERELELTCTPDGVVLVLLGGGAVRSLVLEVADTDCATVVGRRYLLPRLILYMIATYLEYGVVSAGLYVSLAPLSTPPALLLTGRKGATARPVERILSRVADLVERDEPVLPSGGRPPCEHCIYAHACVYRDAAGR
uniref:Dna2/Cas4 domain-containing protein n=1 Tax=Thermofilum pendens TaxID=2269 RepID=A0A7C1T5F6_THEPE